MSHNPKEELGYSSNKFKLFKSEAMVNSDGEIITQGNPGYEWFRTKGITIGDIGIATLSGVRDPEPQPGIGVYFENGKPIFENMKVLGKKGYLQLAVTLHGSLPNLPLAVRLSLPNDTVLSSQLEHDEDPYVQDPLQRQYSIGHAWHIATPSQKGIVQFYDRGDPSFLSQLEFKFFTETLPEFSSPS